MTMAVRRGFTAFAMALGALALTACSGVSNMDMNPGALVTGGRDVAKEQESLRRFASVQNCPEVQVREGTEVLRRFERGKEDVPEALAYQATLKQFARECAVAGDGGSVIKVGVAGRLIAGPTGFSGAASLPLRVAVVKNGDEVVYSELHPVGVQLAAGQGSVAWTQVVEGIVIPYQTVPARFTIYVGFDEMGGKPERRAPAEG